MVYDGLTVTTKEANTVALFSCVNTPLLGVAAVVWPVVVLVLTGLNRIKTPSTCSERTTEHLGKREVVLVKSRMREVNRIKEKHAWPTGTQYVKYMGVDIHCFTMWRTPYPTPFCTHSSHTVCFYTCIVGHHCCAATAPSCQTRLLGWPPSLHCNIDD